MKIKNLSLIVLASSAIIHAADKKEANRGMHEAPPKPVPVSASNGSYQSKPYVSYNERGVKQPGMHQDIRTPERRTKP